MVMNMDIPSINIYIAYFAGLTSFFSPCLVPLLPSYFSIITGFKYEELHQASKNQVRIKIFLSSVFFVLGFSLVYALLGTTGSYIGKLLRTNAALLIQASGIMLIVLGLIQIGIVRFKALQFNHAWKAPAILEKLGYFSALVTGMAIALVWLPCVGQFLGAMLILASRTQTAMQGFWLLFCFSLGLGTPFILLSLFFPSLYPVLQKHQKWLVLINKGSGIVLILIGLVLLTNKYYFLMEIVNRFLY